MAHATVGLCTLELNLPGLSSLKEKRSILQSLLKRLHNTFNVSAAEVGDQDLWQAAVIAFAVTTNSTPHAHQVISNVLTWIEKHYPDVLVVEETIEIL